MHCALQSVIGEVRAFAVGRVRGKGLVCRAFLMLTTSRLLAACVPDTLIEPKQTVCCQVSGRRDRGSAAPMMLSHADFVRVRETFLHDDIPLGADTWDETKAANFLRS
jgi:hypothetical protein